MALNLRSCWSRQLVNNVSVSSWYWKIHINMPFDSVHSPAMNSLWGSSTKQYRGLSHNASSNSCRYLHTAQIWASPGIVFRNLGWTTRISLFWLSVTAPASKHRGVKGTLCRNAPDLGYWQDVPCVRFTFFLKSRFSISTIVLLCLTMIVQGLPVGNGGVVNICTPHRRQNNTMSWLITFWPVLFWDDLNPQHPSVLLPRSDHSIDFF